MAERIEVLEQVGKRHVVLQYAARGATSATVGEPSKGSVAVCLRDGLSTERVRRRFEAPTGGWNLKIK